MSEQAPEVRAAGGIVWRHAAGGVVEVLVVHRPRYDDWTFPKGKLDPGESDEDAALREVEEETGLRCELGRELLGSAYVDHKGRSKEVRYWQMTRRSGAFEVNDEVDEVRWLTVPEAGELLTYGRDRAVLADLRI